MIESVRHVSDNLYRGPRPEWASDVADLVKTFGVTLIVNVQGFVVEAGQVKQEAEWAGLAGVMFRHVPLDLVRPPNAVTVRAILDLVTHEQGKVYVHCHDGVDRTGVVCMAYRMMHGMTFGQALGEMVDDGFHLREYFFWLPFLQTELLVYPPGA